MRGLPIAAVLTLALQACGSSPGTGGPGPGNGPDGGAASLAVSPTSQRVLAGSGPITLQATLVGASGPVSWALSGPGTLGATSGALTTYTPPGTVAADTLVTVTASAGTGLSATVQITVAPPTTVTVDVHGRVVGPTGVGLSGLAVDIGSTSTVSGPDGAFSISGVVPPYDVNVALAGDRLLVGRYEGLTRADPTIVFLWLFTTSEPNTATISGTVSGADPVGTAGEVTAAIFTAPDVRFDPTAISVTARNSPFTLPTSWFGTESITAAVHVLQFKSPGPGQPPTEYTGYGVHDGLALARGAAVENADVTLTRPGNSSIRGAVHPPDGYLVISKALGLELAGLTAIPLGHLDTPDTDFAFAVPEGISATASVTVEAQLAGVGTTFARLSGLVPGATGVSLALSSPALPAAPADGARGRIADATFSWTPLEHAVHLLFVDGGGGTIPAIYIVTAGSSARSGDLPSGTRYRWFVAAFGPFDGVDDFAGGANLFPTLGSSFQTTSEARTFVAE